MTIVNRVRYYCSTKREQGTCASSVGIKAIDLENRILSGLKDILLGNEILIEAFVAEFKAEITRLRKQRGSHERQAHKELNKVNRAIKRCLNFITEGDGEPGLVRDELRSLEGRKHELERTLEVDHLEQEVELHPNIAELYGRKVAELQSLLTDESSRPQAMELIRAMIDRIEVHKGEERGKPEVILIGALSEIIAFTQGKTTAAQNSDGGRVLMVAGARNHRELTLLSVQI